MYQVLKEEISTDQIIYLVRYKKIKERYNKEILRYQRINRQMLAKSSFQSESIANMDQ